jgi:uncharacterized protein (TIGR02594 family)
MSIFDRFKDLFKTKDDTFAKIPEHELREVEPTDIEPEQITEAKRYHGRKEVADRSFLKVLLGIDPATTAWCAAFVNAIEKRCGRTGTGKLNARSYLHYGTPTATPKLGDIAVFKRGNSSWEGHVGYYIFQDDNGILVLGGNQSNKVCYKYYPKAALLGYRKP